MTMTQSGHLQLRPSDLLFGVLHIHVGDEQGWVDPLEDVLDVLLDAAEVHGLSTFLHLLGQGTNALRKIKTMLKPCNN